MSRTKTSFALPPIIAALAFHLAVAGFVLGLGARPISDPNQAEGAVPVTLVEAAPAGAEINNAPEARPFTDLLDHLGSQPGGGSAVFQKTSLTSLLGEESAESTRGGEAATGDSFGNLVDVRKDNVPADLRKLIGKCWRNLGQGAPMLVSFALDRQGHLLGRPKPVKGPFDTASPRELKAAEAVEKCAPYPAGVSGRAYIIELR